MENIGDKNIEEELVKKFIETNAEYHRLASLTDIKKRELETIENELIDLLNDENKKSSARFKGIGFVTALEPSVAQAYIHKEKEEEVFAYLRNIERQDLIKTGVHHTSLAAFINQQLKMGIAPPNGVMYIMKQRLRAYPEK